MRSSRTLKQRLLVTFIVVSICMTVYEAAKQFVRPNISIWQSHTVTIIFSSFIATLSAYFIFRRLDSFQQRLRMEIEERRQHEQALMESETRLAKAEQVLKDEAQRKDDFLAILAHELRNPLSSIRNAIALLNLPGRSIADNQHAMDIFKRQVAQMRRLVDDLLDISRISHGKILLKTCTLDIVELLRGVGDEQRGEMINRNLSFSVRLPGAPLWVHGDYARLTQVFGNLLNNAAKFTPSGGTISLSAQETGEAIEINVVDTGVGMNPEKIAEAFLPFSQTDRSRDRQLGGIGLGLALAKALVELHGGSIHLASDGIGRGCQVSLSFPLAPAAAAAPIEISEESPAPPLRLLVIEDSWDAADSLRMLFEFHGHAVQLAGDAIEGLNVAGKFHPDVIFCDIGLPGMSGYDFARHYRAESNNHPAYLVALTGFGQAKDRARALEAGFDLHLTKPTDPAEVNRVLREFSLRISSPK